MVISHRGLTIDSAHLCRAENGVHESLTYNMIPKKSAKKRGQQGIWWNETR